jgi:glucosamine--fructose-6-phosphate aminotransferase (isomerizing)
MNHPNITLREIHSQPAVWSRCLTELDTTDLAALVHDRLPGSVEWVFVGCGTSYYLAQAAAASFTLLTGIAARALPASEILLHPTLSVPALDRSFLVLISRSGHTSEILAVANFLNNRKQTFLALTCDGNELAQATSRVLQLPVKEDSTVMTSSFTSMLLAMQFLAAKLAGNTCFLDALHRLPSTMQPLLDRYAPAIQQFAAAPFDDVAVLGQGSLYPIASEVALKVMESSSSYAQFFHTLEFRHGPKSIITDRAWLVGLVSETGYEQEIKVIEEMKTLGASTFVVANHATPELRSASDLLIELSLDLPELARLCAYVVWGQLLGSYAGMAKGMDPDNPRNLSRVVTF